MPTSFIVGKKGGGKTLKSMRFLVDELRSSKRSIVTNLPVCYERLREYLLEEYKSDFEMKKRLCIISDDDAARFWEIYGLEEVIHTAQADLPTEKERLKYPEGKYTFIPKRLMGRRALFQSRTGEKETVTAPDFEPRENAPSVLYLIDEVHIYFNSRRWTRMGDDCLFYMSQERHFGDDQILITQNFENVDKAMRFMGQEFIYCVNHRKQKMAFLNGIFKSPPIFTWSAYSDPVTRGGTQTAVETRTFILDKDGLASTYDTAAGVGISGVAGADNNKAKPGLNLMWIVPIVIVALMGIMWAAEWGPKKFIGAFRHDPVPAAKVVQDTPVIALGSSVARFLPQLPIDRAPGGPIAPVPIVAKVEEKFVTGIAQIPGGATAIYLSDGTCRSDKDPDFRGWIWGIGGRVGAMFGMIPMRFAPPERSDSKKIISQ